MQTDRRPSRRSFLAQVAGGGLIVGAGLIFGAKGSAAQPKTRPGTRRMVVDADPRDPARPTGAPPAQPRPADTDPVDPAGRGARVNRATPRGRFVVCPGNTRCPR